MTFRDRRPPRAVETEDAQRGDTPRPAPPTPTRSGNQTPQGAVGYVHTSRTLYDQETSEQETIRVPVFHTDPARVRVGGAVTQSLGSFNFVKIEVAVEMPCLPEISEIERVYQECSEMVDAMCRRELQIATGEGVGQNVQPAAPNPDPTPNNHASVPQGPGGPGMFPSPMRMS